MIIQKLFGYIVHYSDETSDNYRGLRLKNYIQNYEKSKYVPLYLSGNTNSLLIYLNKVYYDSGCLKSITINERIPFEFNILRFLVVLGIMLLIYAVKKVEVFQIMYSHKNLKQEMILIGVMAVFLCLLAFINTYSSSEGQNKFTTDFGLYNKEFIDALYNKQLYLLEDPSEKFLALDNPYDTLVRDENDVHRATDYKWDTAYYNSHQYIYFGILPAISVFLPFYILTKKYLKVSTYIFIVSIGIIILLKEILLILVKRYFKEIPFKNVFYSLISLYSGSLILYINGMCYFYEIVIVAGLFLSLLGIYFVLKSMESDKSKYFNLFFGSLCLALAVACRPTDLLVSIIILPYIIKLLIENIKNIKINKINLLKLCLGVGIPYIIVGIALMYYNYIRFNNPFEFGASYQLTLNNMKALSSGFYSIPIGLFNNLFSIPRIVYEFPFIENYNEILTFYGYYYSEAMLGGLFIIAPICFCCFNIYKAHKNADSKELKLLICVLLFVGLLIATASVKMAGSIERYLMDYAWIFIIDGILIFNINYCNYQHEETKKILQKILCYITIFSFVFSIQAGIVSEKNDFKHNSTGEFFKMRYTICFWE